MGNSTITLQAMVDSVCSIGDLNPVLLNTGGFASEPALTIANDVMQEMIAERTPWKWNEMKLKPFPLISSQQDYASVNVQNIGWLTNGVRVDVNSTQVPPPCWPLYVVRTLSISRVAAGWPYQACWLKNDVMETFFWPGPNVTYVDPLVVKTSMPQNGPTNITENTYGNILVLTTYGTTGPTPPVPIYPPNSPNDPTPNLDADITGQTIQDGTCVWTVANPSAQGIRVYPPPPQGGNTWLVRLFAQKKAPLFTKLTQLLDPIPDDHSKWFRDGFIAYAHRHSSNPVVKARFPQMKIDWLNAMGSAARENDREDQALGFFPDRSIMSPAYVSDPGPGNPYWRNWGGQ